MANSTVIQDKVAKIASRVLERIPDHVKDNVQEHVSKLTDLGKFYYDNRNEYADCVTKRVVSDYDKYSTCAQTHYAQLGKTVTLWMHELPFDEQLIIFAAIGVAAVLIVYVAAKASVSRPYGSRDPDVKSELFHIVDVQENQTESVGDKEAMFMPLLGGIFLCSIYFGIKYLSKETVQWIMSHYLSFAGSMSVGIAVSMGYKGFLRVFFNSNVRHYKLVLCDDTAYRGANSFSRAEIEQMECEKAEKADKSSKSKKSKKSKKKSDTVVAVVEKNTPKKGKHVKKEKTPSTPQKVTEEDTKTDTKKPKINLMAKYFPIITTDEQLYAIHYTVVDILCFFLSMFCLLLTIKYPEQAKNWIINNVFGVCLCITGISTLKLSTFKSGLIMLTGLFFYDIFFVFGTDVMLTVATSIDGPIKLVIPKNEFGKGGLLGLGDMVVPGVYMSLLLRYDLYRYYKDGKQPFHLARKINAPYFVTAVVFYALSLIVTMGILFVFEHGQPALLYICPALIISTFLVGVYQGELGALWAFDGDKELDWM
ncbi:Intramembrane protease 2 [Yarrowia sp. B02]|nr:Intramembrane protease 2 [Yarrowia sp. B02]